LALPAMAVNLPVTPKATITIDGYRDDGYSESFHFDTRMEEWPREGATGTVWTAWNEDYLYLYFEVDDTTPYHDHEWVWYCDCIEIYIDWNNAGGKEVDRSSDAEPYWQVRIASAPRSEDGVQITGETEGNFEATSGNFDAIKFVVRGLNGTDLTGGYAIEVAVPVKEAPGVTLSEGKTITVDFQVSDDRDGENDSMAFLPGDERGQMYHMPDACAGVLTLGPPLPEPEPEQAAEVAEDAPAAVDSVSDAAPVAPAATSPNTGDGMAICIFLIFAAAAVTVAAKKQYQSKR